MSAVPGPRLHRPGPHRQDRRRPRGHSDSLLVAAGSGAATLGIPGSAGVTAGATQDTLTVAHNDLAALEAVLAAGDVAAVIVEGIPGNMGCIPPAPGYLAGVRELTARHGTVFVMDEVMTGFRVAYGGATALYGITPDLVCAARSSAAACRRRPLAFSAPLS
jgi:glutamate-1-semialdehyde 2,1-aminomutase